MALIPNTVVALSAIQTEFGGANPISMSEYYRGGANVPSGQATSSTDGNPIATSGPIRIGMFRNLTERPSVQFTFSSNTANAAINVATAAAQSAQSRTGTYSAGTTDITITINSGVYVYSTTAGTAALSVSGASAGDTVTIINNGFIAGRGGTGGTGGAGANAGSTALNLSCSVTVNNTNGAAYIGGGGGGGGWNSGTSQGSGGGGAGGANGGSGSGGAGGGPGASGANATAGTSGGGGGGRIFPGTGGAAVAGLLSGVYPGLGGGSGGSGGIVCSQTGSGTKVDPITTSTFSGGGGGGWGASGGFGRYASSAGVTSGGGGSGNAAGGNTSGGTGTSGTNNGAAGGKAVALNGNTVTWVGGDTTRVYGAIS